MITNSLDWNAVETELMRKARKSTYAHDIFRMIRSIRIEVSKLGQLEVEARARGRNRPAEEMVVKINKDIEEVESYILIGALIG